MQHTALRGMLLQANNIQDSIEVQKRYWNSLPAQFVGPLTAPQIAPFIFTAIDHKVDTNDPSIKLLDFGCGVGRLYRAIAPKCFYTGVDICKNYLVQARRECPNIPFIQLHKQDTPFKSNSFDIAISYSVLTHVLLDPQGIFILKELYRVLKNNSPLVVSIFSSSTTHEFGDSNWIIYNHDEWELAIKECGFIISNVTTVPENSRGSQSLYTLLKI